MISYELVLEVHCRRYLMRQVGLEVFGRRGGTWLLAFDTIEDRNAVHRHLVTAKTWSEQVKHWKGIFTVILSKCRG